MPKKAQQPKKRELKVVLDTNAIFTGSASDLFRREVADVISAIGTPEDLKIKWLLPEIVVHERQYQMLRRALDLLPTIQKLERLLGHNLAITSEILESRVRECVNKQLNESGSEVAKLNSEEVSWEDLILASAYRKPPFETGEGEKGFRDALVVETFLQTLAGSPSTARVCTVVLVSGDALVREAATARTEQAKNVRVLESVDELKGFINTLVAEVDEEYVEDLVPKAKAYFFEKENEDTLFYKQAIQKQLKTLYGEQLKSKPPGAKRRVNGTWFVNTPRFLRKEGQRVFWVTRIRVAAEAFAKAKSSVPPVPRLSLLDILAAAPGTGTSATGAAVPPSEPKPADALENIARVFAANRSAASEGEGGEDVLLATGETVFEVTWSIAVTTNGRLSRPKIEELAHVENTWELA